MLLGFFSGLVAGLIVHVAAPGAPWVKTLTTYVTGPIGQIFLRLLFMLVIPLVFSALVVGVAKMGDVRSLKRIGIKTLVFTIGLSSIAVALSLMVVNIFQPGAGVDPALARTLLADARGGAGAILSRSAETPTGMDAILNIIPNNVVAAAADNDILALIFFALVFGIGLLLVNSAQTARLQEAIEGIFQVNMRLIGIVIRFAPIAIAAFMFNLSALFGWGLLIRLSAYVPRRRLTPPGDASASCPAIVTYKPHQGSRP
jgi:DAACS family dicarboxylate/amino acid:cation (Na+ or H+) symporter